MSATEGLRCGSLSDPRGDEGERERREKNEAPFQPAEDCRLLTETERSFVRRWGRGGGVYQPAARAAGWADHGGEKKLIMIMKLIMVGGHKQRVERLCRQEERDEEPWMCTCRACHSV